MLLVFPALEAALHVQAVAHLELGGVAGGTAPGDAGDIIALAKGAVDGQHQVRNLPAEGRGAEGRGLADGPGQVDKVGVFVIVWGQKPLGEGGEQQPSRAAHHLVIGAQLPLHRDAHPGGHLAVHQPFRHRDGQDILGPGQAGHPQLHAVKMFAEYFVVHYRRAVDHAAERQLVVFRFHVHTSGTVVAAGRWRPCASMVVSPWSSSWEMGTMVKPCS